MKMMSQTSPHIPNPTHQRYDRTMSKSTNWLLGSGSFASVCSIKEITSPLPKEGHEMKLTVDDAQSDTDVQSAMIHTDAG
jgi:hypothetical protein